MKCCVRSIGKKKSNVKSIFRNKMLMLVGNVRCLYSLFAVDGREPCNGKQITFSRRIGPQSASIYC